MGTYFEVCPFGVFLSGRISPTKASRLLEPLGQVVASPQIVYENTKPTRQENGDSRQYLSGQRNGLLQDVEHAPNGADQTG